MNFSLKKALKFSFWIGLAFASGTLLFVFLVWMEAFGAIPNKKELTEIQNATATLVYSEDEVLLGQYFSENRTNVSYKNLPPHLLEALVSTEDARFYEHDGIDTRSLFRVLIKSILMGDRDAGGGSTITQQLAKNLFGRARYGFLSMPVNKTKEMILAQRLESLYSKEEILELYLNTVSFSENTYGIGAGSRRFFDKVPQELRVEEAAVLVGLLKANTYYNPRLYPEHALKRRNVVLYQMSKFGNLTVAEKDSLQALPIKLAYQNLANNSRAPYFLEQVKRKATKILENYNLKEKTAYNLESDGLIITTTLNYTMQVAAEKAMQKHMRYLQQKFNEHWAGKNPWGSRNEVYDAALQSSSVYKNWQKKALPIDSLNAKLNKKHRVQLLVNGKDSVYNVTAKDSIIHYINLLNAGFLALDPKTGGVKTWIGGLNYRFLPYDHVLSSRQAASTFKPIIYATALEQDVDPCHYFENEQRVYEEYDGWMPGNYEDEYGGYFSMAGALKKSVNVVAVQAIFDAGISNVLVKARQLGIESQLPARPSLALGTGSVSLLEMVRAYGVFANQGMLQATVFITKIETANGEVLYESGVTQPKSALSRNNARLITAMLEGVVNEGTGVRLRSVYGLRNAIAGKTGTAQNYTDGWFIGYTPTLVAGAWVGASSPAVHFRSGAYGSGSAMALPIFGGFFHNLKANAEVYNSVSGSFKPLSDEQIEGLDCPDYKEGNLVDEFKSWFEDQEGEDVEEDKPNFFQRLFNKDKD